MEFNHIPVLLEESIKSLNIKPDGIYVDATAGGGGHSEQIAKNLSENGVLFCFDRDPDAIKELNNKFKSEKKIKIINSQFSNMKNILNNRGIFAVDGILMDLGVSSFQLDNDERGFSYHKDAPLDMRMNKEGTSAFDVINNLDENELQKIISIYGEEKFAKSISKNIVKTRSIKEIKTTLHLVDVIKESLPYSVKRKEKHPARKTFQAIRIYVNDELGELKKVLDDSLELLKKGGRLCAISFHSSEDRIIKQKMKEWNTGCICPKDFPICVCNNKEKVKIITKKPITENDENLSLNKRSRSAKLRVCEKL